MFYEPENYSYYLAYVDTNKNVFGNASGFLFRKKGYSYLITNVHVLFGVRVSDLSSQKQLENYGNFKICLRYKKQDKSIGLFDIEIDKHRHELSKFLFPKMLDVFCYQLPTLPNDGQFYYINEDFELEDNFQTELSAYGYPAIDHIKEREYKNRKCRKFQGITNGDLKDKNRRINTTLLIECGMSGCPIFSFKQVNGFEIIKFYGIGDGYNPHTNSSIVTYLFASFPFNSFFN